MYNTRGPKENINRAFQIFDYDNSGRITLRKLRRIAKFILQYTYYNVWTLIFAILLFFAYP